MDGMEAAVWPSRRSILILDLSCFSIASADRRVCVLVEEARRRLGSGP